MTAEQHAAQLAEALAACKKVLHPGAIGLIAAEHGWDKGNEAGDAWEKARAALDAWDRRNARPPTKGSLL